jgi:hypothetical protein
MTSFFFGTSSPPYAASPVQLSLYAYLEKETILQRFVPYWEITERLPEGVLAKAIIIICVIDIS